METVTKLTDFQKLLICKSYVKSLLQEIKELKFESGVKQSEIDELKHLVNRAQLNQVTKEEFAEIVKSEVIERDRQSHLVALKKRDEQLKELKSKIHMVNKESNEIKRQLKNLREQNMHLVNKLLSQERIIEKLTAHGQGISK